MGDQFGAEWDDLAREVDLWRAAGQAPTLWWRDDDAIEATPALRELQRVARGPLALAVIPASPDRPLQDSLAGLLADWPQATVLQHGITHQNQAQAGGKKSEFPLTWPLDDMTAGLALGSSRLQNSFGVQFLPVLTPPWNRMADAWLPHLPGLGYRGISRFGEPPYIVRPMVTGLREVNTQVDVIDWRGSRGFVGLKPALGRLVGHLAARRARQVDAETPTGLLTHHLVHDTATWRFLENLQDWLASRGEGGAFLSPATLWPAR